MYQKVPQLCYCKLDWYANHVVPINSKKMAVKKEAVQADTCEYVAVHKDNYKQSHQDNPPICPAKQKNSPLASKVTTSSDAQASTLTSPNEMAIESGTTRVEPISSIQNMANNPPNDPFPPASAHSGNTTITLAVADAIQSTPHTIPSAVIEAASVVTASER
ncbi:hypothetical protein SERLA73DRAFT_150213 [Serpula lacrymans var. lacrymans S7.3]|uniref:Uncharacterized protein n=1 Tax=Serpula lacrymans var. lacrymans (strain S7.3) TaxID=936435 RepID=F8PLJ1_SERL3|nr:hypothetical protein SERLA73DRAFT_150213 [Serpula lacrymans var. lacrymans S7.3]